MSPLTISIFFQKNGGKDQLDKIVSCQRVFGEILMISGYQSHEFGFGLGLQLTPHIRNLINMKRRNQNYTSEVDDMLIHSNIKKGVILDNPLLRYFRYGVNCEGY